MGIKKEEPTVVSADGRRRRREGENQTGILMRGGAERDRIGKRKWEKEVVAVVSAGLRSLVLCPSSCCSLPLSPECLKQLSLGAAEV